MKFTDLYPNAQVGTRPDPFLGVGDDLQDCVVCGEQTYFYDTHTGYRYCGEECRAQDLVNSMVFVDTNQITESEPDVLGGVTPVPGKDA